MHLSTSGHQWQILLISDGPGTLFYRTDALWASDLGLCKKLANNFKNPRPYFRTLDMTHVAGALERDPSNARDELKEGDLSNVMRCIIFTVVDECRGLNLWQTGYNRPLFQRAKRRQR
jgi:hypothetical protein